MVVSDDLRQYGREYIVKDSGTREEFASGMVRDVTEGKVRYHLVFDGPMLERWAEHLTKGAQKYADRNWMKADGLEEADRFRESAVRHFVQWMRGDDDEDHASAVFFNINGYEFVMDRLAREDDVLGYSGATITVGSVSSDNISGVPA